MSDDACDEEGCSEPRVKVFPPTVGDKQHDLLGRIDTSQLYPPFLERINTMLNACAMRGALYVATCGNRDWASQDALYARGRTAPPLGDGHIVTKARGGQSAHNFEGAIDFARHRGVAYAGKLDPDYADAAYEILAEEAERVGLESGLRWPGNFKDSPHVQLPVKKWGLAWSQLAAIYRSGGRAALYAEYDKHMGILR